MPRTPRTDEAPLSQLIESRMHRRSFLALGAAGMAAAMDPFKGAWGAAQSNALTFAEIPHGLDDRLHVSPGHEVQVLLAWGDALQKGSPPFDPATQSVEEQEKRFGYDSDFTTYRPFKEAPNEHGLLCVNHEQGLPNLMFPRKEGGEVWPALSRWEANIEMAANGHSVVEIKKEKNAWRVVHGRFNRRLSARSTRIPFAGPAAGDVRLKTRDDPQGRVCLGTLANCGGGVTPWDNVLISEENFDAYFTGNPENTSEAENHRRYDLHGEPYQSWGHFEPRFNVEKEPHEPNRFGWVVEFDPFNPGQAPKKRTALGRFKHESASCALAADNRVVVYSGDDEAFEYLYRYVSDLPFDPAQGKANASLLDQGTLSVAHFSEDGTLRWRPLRFGEGPLTPKNRFKSQADVLIETRRAADLVGATPLDRPEGIDIHTKSQRVFVALTKNRKRKGDQLSKLHPRGPNTYGQVVELVPPQKSGKADHGADVFAWEIFLLGGDPKKPESGARMHPDTTAAGHFSCPDNLGFDPQGRLWVTTDGLRKVAGVADGLWAVQVEGRHRALPRHFLRAPLGAEVCSPTFTPDGSTLFAAIQHPGAVKGASYQNPPTRWPDFKNTLPPRPGVVAIQRSGGGPVGG